MRKNSSAVLAQYMLCDYNFQDRFLEVSNKPVLVTQKY